MNRNLFSLTAIFVMAMFVFVSCSDDDDDFPAPLISNLEIGHHNSMIGHPGHDLHIDADIVAEGRIESVVIEIHYEGDHHHDHKSGQHDDHDGHAWEFEHTWTEFSGLLNARFHKHIDIPEDAKTGHYHFHFKVIDQQGKVTEIEEEFELKHGDHDDDHDHDHDH